MSTQPRPCPSCGGAGGRTETTSDGKTFRQNWHSCGSCRGSGVAR